MTCAEGERDGGHLTRRKTTKKTRRKGIKEFMYCDRGTETERDGGKGIDR